MLKGLQISRKELVDLRQISKKKKIVLCHGAFDIVHPGHIDHLENAKKLGDILVVTITADHFLKKHLHSPLYNQNERLNFLKKLKIIDYVFIANSGSAIPSLNLIRPNFYCKGIEYKKDDLVGNLNEEKKIAKKIKCQLIFLGSNIKSSSKIFAENFFEITDKNLEKQIRHNKKLDITKLFKKISKLRILVIGEIIFDKYTYLNLKGISPKSNVLSYIKDKENYMSGGALASYLFLKSFIKNTKFISIINKKQTNKKILNILKKISTIKSNCFRDIVKERLIEVVQDNKIKKLITVNEYEEKELSLNDEKQILQQISKNAPKCDLIIVQDFGHNFFTKKIISKLEKFKNKLSINVQTNSLNYGYNIIDKKFKKASFFSLDEKELKLFSSKKKINYESELKKLISKLSARHGYLTLGGKFSIVTDGKKCFKISTLNKNPVDTMGAGDIFHALSSVLSKTNNNIFVNLFLSQIAGAHAVGFVGNSAYPEINEIIRTYQFYVQSLNSRKKNTN